MTIKRADWVVARAAPHGPVGVVLRLALDGSWADVDWATHTKRMATATLRPLHTLDIGNGWEVTDDTRRRELEEEP